MNAVSHIAWSHTRAWLLAAVLCSTAACGLKGPLYLPDQKPDMVEVKAPSGLPLPTSQKKDRQNTGQGGSKQSSGTQSEPTSTPPER